MLMLQHILPEIMEVHLTTMGLGFGAGVVMSGLLLRLLRRSTRNQPDARAKYYQAATALMWNLGGLLSALLPIFGGATYSLPMFVAATLNFSGAAFFPAGFLALWRRPSDETSPRAEACRYLCTLALVEGTILTACFVVVACDPNQIQRWEGSNAKLMSNLVAIHVAVLMVVGAALLLRGRLNGFAAKFYATTTLIGVTAPALMIVPIWLGRESPMMIR